MLHLYISIFLLLTLAYAVMMLLFRMGWKRHEAFHVTAASPSTSVSIIIPARNEAANIGACINSILKQDYPTQLFEIIVIDDHSTDDTVTIVKSFVDKNVRCLALADFLKEEKVNAYKKKALTAGIKEAKGELIITTDADCTVSEGWLRNIAGLFEKGDAVMICAPVVMTNDDSLLQRFQWLDFMTMQGITVAVHHLKMGLMGNGANLAFSKAAFMAIGGYEGTEHLASGDDYLLMAKMEQHFPGKIRCLKSPHAIVRTEPQYTWNGFLQQRIRWASKSGKYDDKKLTAVLMLVYLFNLFFLIGIPFASALVLKLLAAMLIVKTTVELVFLYPVAGFFKDRKQLIYFPFLQPLHIIYIVVAGFLGMAGNYKWKGRSVS